MSAHSLGVVQLINPDTGKPAVSEAVQVSQIYQGENLINLPDIVIRWALGAPIHRLYHPRLGLISNGNVLLRTAQHTSDGFLIATGRHINRAASFTNANTVDLAPTILYLMEQNIPREMDGKVLLDLFEILKTSGK